MSDSDDNSIWLWILFFILFLGPCQSTEQNERDIKSLEEEKDRLEKRIDELEHWRDSR